MSHQLVTRLVEHAWEEFPHEAADAALHVAPAVSAQMLAPLPAATLGRALMAFPPHLAAAIIPLLPEGARAPGLATVPSVILAQLLRRIPSEARETILEGLDKGLRRRVTPMLALGQATAAALAEPDVLTLFGDALVNAALEAHRDGLICTLHEVPVLDREHKLIGMVSPTALLRANGAVPIEGVMHRDVAKIASSATLSQIVNAPGWQAATSLAVVDGQGVFAGLLRYETMRWVEQQLTTRQPVATASTARALGDLFSTAIGGVLEAVVAAADQQEGRAGHGAK